MQNKSNMTFDILLAKEGLKLARFTMDLYLNGHDIDNSILGATVGFFNANDIEIRDEYNLTNEDIHSRYPMLEEFMKECPVVNKWKPCE